MVVPCWHINLVLHLHFNNKQQQQQCIRSVSLSMHSFTIACLSDLASNLKRTLRAQSAGFLCNNLHNLNLLELSFFICIDKDPRLARQEELTCLTGMKTRIA